MDKMLTYIANAPKTVTLLSHDGRPLDIKAKSVVMIGNAVFATHKRAYYDTEGNVAIDEKSWDVSELITGARMLRPESRYKSEAEALRCAEQAIAVIDYNIVPLINRLIHANPFIKFPANSWVPMSPGIIFRYISRYARIKKKTFKRR